MTIGRVKWFNNEKGYGFIETDASKQDVFVHFSDIQMEGYKTLQADVAVCFDLEQGARGPSARQVRPLTTDSHAQTPYDQVAETPAVTASTGSPAMPGGRHFARQGAGSSWSNHA